MQVFEFLFNPKSKEGLIFDSFCYDPENIYEKRMGSLYMIGILKNALPQNAYFIGNLAKTIREKYYKTISATPERSLKETLKKANEYLERTARNGDVSWLGNFSFAALSLKNRELNFTKIGDIKIFLIRKGQIIDIDQRLKFEEIEPYPLKVFGNIVSGSLNEDDIILSATREASDFFIQENLMQEFAKISLHSPLSEGLKKIRKVFEAKQEKLSEISGSCLFVSLNKEIAPKEKEILTAQKTNLSNFVRIPETIIIPLKKIFQTPRKASAKTKKLAVLGKNLFAFSNLAKHFKKITLISFNKLPISKNLSLVIFLIILLLIGSFISRKEEENQLKNHKESIEAIEVMEAK